MNEIIRHIEAILFASSEPVRASEIMQWLKIALAIDITKKETQDFIQKIQEKYADEDFVMRLIKVNNGYQFVTKESYHETLQHVFAQREKKKISQSALETLAIIAYRQPVTKLDVEQIRGVDSDYTIRKLLEKRLIKITGKAATIGKPLLYGTSDEFMKYFGLNKVSDLPTLKDMSTTENSIGDNNE